MNIIEQTIQRSDCFRLLAACFYEPDKQLFRKEPVLDNLSRLMGELAPQARRPLQAMRDSMEETAEETLRVDYAALFVGPFELLAPPYGSLYLEKNNQVLGNSTVAVQRFYEDAGLSLTVREPADHIAIELEFMAYLTAQEAQARATGDEEPASNLRSIQSIFHHQVMTWVPALCDRIRSGALTEYYMALAEGLRIFHDSCGQEYSVRHDTPG